jgi:tetratricopeptide (TPR) repeat protein
MKFAAVFTLALAALAQQPKAADNCAPPPSALAPTLPAKLLDGMGTVHLAITTSSPEAQKFFDQGVAQMHSFWAREAERSFLQAAALDPAAPMPQWGIAMVAAGDWRPRFQIDTNDKFFGRNAQPARSRARIAAEKAVELANAPGKATDLEKMYVAAIAARRDPNAKDPEDAFVKGLRSLLAAHPGEVEAELDLALMIMRGFTLPDHKPAAPGSTEAVEILRSLLARVPDHPGVHHYIIHGWEGSSFAKEAWPSCAKYAELVPNIPHALHMPGHIYSQTGRYADAAKSFADAAANERKWMKEDKLYGDGHHGHNVHYLATAYSFEGRYDDAIEAAKELLGYAENPRTAAMADQTNGAHAQGWFAMLRTLVQFEKWDEILGDQMLPVLARPRQEAWRHWAKALALSAKGQAAAAREEAAKFDQSLAEYRTKTKRTVNPEEMDVARLEITAHLDLAEGHPAKALKEFETASKAERKLRYTEPPYYPRPVAESWGHAAQKAGKMDEARKAFRIAQEQYPGDAHAVMAGDDSGGAVGTGLRHKHRQECRRGGRERPRHITSFTSSRGRCLAHLPRCSPRWGIGRLPGLQDRRKSGSLLLNTCGIPRN